ncbi:hypothetical protein HA402_012596 [Bradysia odoriphaga]|nr:hypothetical protein HA402_012596 [Bradysia odoriphaga]
MNHLVLLVLSVSAMAFTSNACQFGSEAIQTVYDRFELFRKTKAFDPADSKIPLEQYQFYNNDGEKRLAVKINGVYMVEYYRTDTDNKLQTKNGQYHVKDGVILNYKRDENGEFSFDDWSNQKKFKSSLRSIDAELPNDFEEDYKQILVDLNAMRKKMFDYQNGLSKEDFERVQLFEFTPFSNGDGFYAQKTKAFDPADSQIPLEQYQFYINDGGKRLAVKINGVYMVEYSKTDGDNKLQTENGQYHVEGGVILNYNRDENGEFSFDDWSNHKKFKSSLRSIDAELPNDFEEDYKQVLVDLNAMRKKMFDFQNGLSKEDFERVQLFEFTPFSPRDGFSAQYIEKDGGSLSVSKENGSDNIFGRLSCEHRHQKYNIVDGKVVVDGEPFVPAYH